MYQIRPDQPRVRNGRRLKYETPRSSRMVLDVIPRFVASSAIPAPLCFSREGIRKGDSALSHGRAVSRFSGVWNWRGTNEHGARSRSRTGKPIALNGRDAYSCSTPMS